MCIFARELRKKISMLSGIKEIKYLNTSRIIMTAIVILWGNVFLRAQDNIGKNAFESGEYLSYELKYKTTFGELDAGKAQVEIKLLRPENDPNGEDRTIYHVVANGKTNKFFDFFFKVRDHFESFMDTSTLLPERFVSHTHEGNYVFNDEVRFDRKNKEAISTRNGVPIPDDVHDILSSVYFLRTVTLDDFGPDSIFYFDFFLNDSVYHSKVIFLGRETLDTGWGKITCLKVKPVMATGEVFARKYPVIMWVTDDRNHIPVRAESEIIVGSVVMELVGFRNLKNPFIQSLTNNDSNRWKRSVR